MKFVWSSNNEFRLCQVALLTGGALFVLWIFSIQIFWEIYGSHRHIDETDIQFEEIKFEIEKIFVQLRESLGSPESLKSRPKREDYTSSSGPNPKEQMDLCKQCARTGNGCPRGPPGPQGAAGHPGENGLDGVDGENGAPGISLIYDQEEPGCISCPPGPPGPPGFIGHVGDPGPIGDPGEYGIPGESASDGPIGPPGDPGVSGIKGPPGRAGLSGLDGTRGKGLPGRTGSPGPLGLPGVAGLAGTSTRIGPPGPEGARGRPGADGFDGLNGPPGEPGQLGEPGLNAQYCPCPRRSSLPSRSDDLYRPAPSRVSSPSRAPAEIPYEVDDQYRNSQSQQYTPSQLNPGGPDQNSYYYQDTSQRIAAKNRHINYYSNNYGNSANSRYQQQRYGSGGDRERATVRERGASQHPIDRVSFRRALMDRLERKFGNALVRPGNDYA